MSIQDLRDPEEALLYVAQGFWLQRVARPQPEALAEIIGWALEMAGSGEPLPPIGFIADVGQLLFQAEPGIRRDDLHVPGWPAGLARVYEDHVLGKLYTDSSFERAGDALRRYNGRDRVRGLTFLLTQLRHRAGFGGVHFSPAILKAVLKRPAEEVLARGWDSLGESGPLPLLSDLIAQVTVAVRNTGSVFGPEDVFELEHGTALAQFSQRVALRQVLQAAAALDARLAGQRPRPSHRRHEVSTRILEEDVYPVGGFASISNRGSIESLLHSQLALMEKDSADRPDLFDIRYLRDELLYYSRDENQFLRRRQSFVFAFDPDLAQARFKDEHLPWQRIILALALTLVMVRKSLEWLSTDALTFDFLLLQEGDNSSPLPAEQAVLEMVFREQIANGTVSISHLPKARLATHCVQRARRSLCHCLTLSTTDRRFAVEQTRLARLVVAGAAPGLALGEDERATVMESDDAVSCWLVALERLLKFWQ